MLLVQIWKGADQEVMRSRMAIPAGAMSPLPLGVMLLSGLSTLALMNEPSNRIVNEDVRQMRPLEKAKNFTLVASTVPGQQRNFESCPAGYFQESISTATRTEAEAGVAYACADNKSPSSQCSCAVEDTMLLYSFEGGSVKQSCCPLDFHKVNSSLVCSGCATFFNGECTKCLGGFTQMASNCVKCTNVHSFVDVEGHSCASYVTNGWCRNGAPTKGNELKASKVYQHLSAADACCACGGGIHSGTPFEYVLTRANGIGLAGENFLAEPYPRTANKYVLSPGCDLEKYGLTLDGNTGVISGFPFTEEPFDATCEVSALAPKVGNLNSPLNWDYRQFKTKVKISTKAFGYKAADDPSQAVVKAMIFDEASFMRTYRATWSSKFKAKSPQYKITCAPASFIELDPVTGDISLGANMTSTKYAKLFYNYKGGRAASDKASTPSGNEEYYSSQCHIVATDDTKTIHHLDVKIFAYPPVPPQDIDFYPTSALRVTVGQPLVSQLQLGYKDAASGKVKKPWNMFSVNLDCISSTNHPVVYELSTGDLTIHGLPIVNVQPMTGELSGSPHVGLRAFMPAVKGRASFTVACDVYGALPSAEIAQQVRLVKAKSKLVIQVDNDHCWVDAAGFKSPEGWVARLKSPRGNSSDSETACKHACTLSPACAGYNFVPKEKRCYELAVVTDDVPHKSGHALKGPLANVKVDNCQVHQTCVQAKFDKQAYLSGLYCPLLKESKALAQPIYVMQGLHLDDTFYLMRYDRTKLDALPAGCTDTNTGWVVRKASLKKDDLVDIEKAYVEMHGEVEACILGDLVSAPDIVVLGASAITVTPPVKLEESSGNATDAITVLSDGAGPATTEDPELEEVQEDSEDSSEESAPEEASVSTEGVPMKEGGKVVEFPESTASFASTHSANMGLEPGHANPSNILNSQEVRPGVNVNRGYVRTVGPYILEFKLKLKGVVKGWGSIVHLTTKDNCCKNGDRVPAVWVKPGTSQLHFRTGTSSNGNDGCDPTESLGFNRYYSIKMEVDQFSTVKIFYDGKQVCTRKMPGAIYPAGTIVTVYAGDPWHESPNAMLKDLSYRKNDPNKRLDPTDMLEGRTTVLTKDEKIGVVTSLGYYSLELDIQFHAKIAAWGSIVHMTTKNNCCNNGDRVPGIWAAPGTTKLHIRTGTSKNGNDGCDPKNPLPLNRFVRVRVEVRPDSSMEVFYDNQSVCKTKLSGTPYPAGNLLNVFAGDTWYEPASATIKMLSYGGPSPTMKPTLAPTNKPTYPRPTPNPTSRQPTQQPTSDQSSSPTASIVPRVVMDSVPVASLFSKVLGVSNDVAVSIQPMGKGCISPLVDEDPSKTKSSTEDEAGNSEPQPDSEDQEKERGVVKGKSSAVDDKFTVFRFDDPTTVTEDDYYLHPCECFFEEWGDNAPVDVDSYEAAAVGSMGPGMSFNKFIPKPVLLWSGPHMCDQRFLINQITDSQSCALSCNDDPTCRYFGEMEGDGGRMCLLFSDCQYMTRIDLGAIVNLYGVFKPAGSERLCHIASPEKCWHEVRRRALLTGQGHRYKSCYWEHLINQCDFNQLMGDSELEKCARCEYMITTTQETKRKMPETFPHGAQLSASCDDSYTLLTNKGADGTVVCMDGEWRDSTGAVGLTNLQCAGCVQVFNAAQKAIEMKSGSMEELLFMGGRRIGLFMATSSEYPSWIEVESGRSIVIMSRPSLKSFSWSMDLDGTSSMQLSDTSGGKCLAVRDYPMGSKAYLDVLTLRRCQLTPAFATKTSLLAEPDDDVVSLAEEDGEEEEEIENGAEKPSPATSLADKEEETGEFDQVLSAKAKKTKYPTQYPTKYPSRAPSQVPTKFPTSFPSGDDKVMLLPNEAFARVAKQEETRAASSSSSGWACSGSTGFLNKLGKQSTCVQRARSSKAKSLPVVEIKYDDSLSVMCRKGEAMYSLKQNSPTQFTALCNPLPGLGECTQIRFQHSHASFDPVTSVLNIKKPIKCPSRSIVTGFQADRTSTNTKIAVTCCMYPFYSGLVLSEAEPISGFSSDEGIYCPTGYDDLLRPRFKQSSTYSKNNLVSLIQLGGAEKGMTEEEGSPDVAPDTDAAVSTAKEHDEQTAFAQTLVGKSTRYPTKYPTKYPTAYPTRYPSKQPTRYPTNYPTSYPTPYPKPEVATVKRSELLFDKSLNSWCLIPASGGDRKCTQPHRHAEHPFSVDWLLESKKGLPFSVIELGVMSGKGMTGGVMPPPNGLGASVPQKPTLIKFKTEKPKYSEGCAAIENDKFKEATEIFDKGSACALLASTTWKRHGKDGGPGLNYETMNECHSEDLKRDYEMHTYLLALGAVKASMKLGTAIGKFGCKFLPDKEVGGGGGLAGPFFGLSIKYGDMCEGVADLASEMWEGLAEVPAKYREFKDSKESYEDCNPLQVSVLRILCDLHCVKDAVKAGTSAVIRNIAKSNQNIVKNSDMLMNYYSQVVMNKMETEVAKINAKNKAKMMLLDDNADMAIPSPHALHAKLSKTLAKYLQPEVAAATTTLDQVDLNAAKEYEGGVSKAIELIASTHSALKSSQNPRDASETLVRSLERLDTILGRAHALSNQRQSQSRSKGLGASLIRTQVRETSARINSTIGVRLVLLDDIHTGIHDLKKRGQRLYRDVQGLSKRGEMSVSSALNWKLDLLTNEVLVNRAKMERQSLQGSLLGLSQLWNHMHAQVSSYVSVYKQQLMVMNKVIGSVGDYLNCHGHVEFLDESTSLVSDATELSENMLRKAYEASMEALESHQDVMLVSDVPTRMIHAAADSVKLRDGKTGQFWLSHEGLDEVKNELGAAIDDLPFSLSRQALSMIGHTRFLHSRMGRKASQEDTGRLEAAMRSLSSLFKRSFDPLRSHSHTLGLIQSVIDTKIASASPAPAVCKELAFEQYRDVTTASLVKFASREYKGLDVDILTPPLAKLLSYPSSFRISLSQDFANQSVPDDFPVSMLHSTYVCYREGGAGPWQLKRAMELPRQHAVSFCSGDACTQGDLEISQLRSLMDMKTTKVMKLWGSLWDNEKDCDTCQL